MINQNSLLNICEGSNGEPREEVIQKPIIDISFDWVVIVVEVEESVGNYHIHNHTSYFIINISSSATTCTSYNIEFEILINLRKGIAPNFEISGRSSVIVVYSKLFHFCLVFVLKVISSARKVKICWLNISSC